MTDLPLDQAVRAAEEAASSGFLVFQKFTCTSCGSRQSIPEPFKFYTRASCEECLNVSEISECGFILIAGPKAPEN